jgi:hypothetical protein
MARPPSHSSGRALTKHVSLAPHHQSILHMLRQRWGLESDSATVRRALEYAAVAYEHVRPQRARS